jgi:hypothetical protein
MKKLTFAMLTIVVAALSSAKAIQLATFDFTAGSLADSAGASGITVGNVTTGSSFLTFTSASGWTSAAQISAASGFFSTPTTQASAGNALIFTITANANFKFTITGFSFQARSTATSPGDIGFTINGAAFDFSSSYSNNSTITTIQNLSLSFTNLSSGTISIQGWNATGSGLLQLDNLSLIGTIVAVPEPHEVGVAIAGLLGVAVVMRRRMTARMA